VPAAPQPLDGVVAQGLDDLERARILAEEVLADVAAASRSQSAALAVERVVHDLDERALVVLGQQGVPLTAPHHLDHVPARTG